MCSIMLMAGVFARIFRQTVSLIQQLQMDTTTLNKIKIYNFNIAASAKKTGQRCPTCRVGQCAYVA